MSHSEIATPRNRLLASLPRDDLALLLPRLETVKFAIREILIEPGEPIGSVCFPETGWASNVVMLANGDAGEVGLIGREGFVGLPLLFGDNRTSLTNIAQAASTALRLGADEFLHVLGESNALRERLCRYSLAFQAQVAQTAACNGRHHLDQRLARWLLMAHDRADGDSFPMTHEFLSMMLGVRRAGVTVAAQALQGKGLIRYSRGTIEVIERSGLEHAACECYGAVRNEFERLLGEPGTAR